jgi:methylmalonyl-CoA/ethylmalonyl-CoA epimerase
MKKGILGTRVVTQVALLVRDIETTAQVYADFLGVPRPAVVVTDALEKSQAKYRGNPTPARAKLAFFDVGPGLQLELIEPDHNPSTWREDLDRKGECVHHIAFQVKGMKDKVADLAKEGMTLVQAGEFTGGRYAYVDANRDLKILLELLEND